MNPDLFIGVVTYPGTRFPQSSGPEGLAESLATCLAGKGCSTIVRVHGEDVYRPELLRIDSAEIARSIDAELAAELDWKRHVSGRAFQPLSAAKLKTHRVLRRRKLLPKHSQQPNSESAGFRMVRRLVNIEYAHLNLMRDALAVNAEWILIVEDDATLDATLVSMDDFATSLVELFASAQEHHEPGYINISRSHSDSELGTEDIYVAALPFAINATRKIHARVAKRPVTNTVCAILYRREFLEALVDQLERIQLSPVLPIDWKLNRALMNMSASGLAPEGTCWSLAPAPIIQGSMHESNSVQA